MLKQKKKKLPQFGEPTSVTVISMCKFEIGLLKTLAPATGNLFTPQIDEFLFVWIQSPLAHVQKEKGSW